MDYLDFRLQHYAKEGTHLLKKAKEILQKSNLASLKAFENKIPEKIIKDDEKLKIAFVGQYSAGKSTLLKVLTGIDSIETGSGITTQKTSHYDWNGIEVWDTPGIQTGVREDHDEITNKAIAESDLIVFLVTNELFDDKLADYFRNLAIEKEKGHEMMLVVNKMQRHVKGNTEEAHQIVREALKDVVAPLSVDNLYITFTDVLSYTKASEFDDQEIRDAYAQKSGLLSLINNLELFIADKNLVTKYTSSLYTLQDILEKCLETENCDDPDVDAAIDLLKKKLQKLRECERNIRNKCNDSVKNVANETRNKGRKIAGQISSSMNNDEVNNNIKNLTEEVDSEVVALCENIEKIIGEEITGVSENLQELLSLDVTQMLIRNLQSKLPEISSSSLKTSKTIGEATTELGKFIIKNCENGKGIGKYVLGKYSGSTMHETVKALAKWFGKDFKWRPWEAVRWTEKIAKAGAVLKVVGPMITCVAAWIEDSQEQKQIREIAESRKVIRSGFNDAAESIEMKFDKEINAYISTEIDPELIKTEEEMNRLLSAKAQSNATLKELSELNEQVTELIGKIHKIVNLNQIPKTTASRY